MIKNQKMTPNPVGESILLLVRWLVVVSSQSVLGQGGVSIVLHKNRS
jgi:hypothetical protein